MRSGPCVRRQWGAAGEIALLALAIVRFGQPNAATHASIGALVGMTVGSAVDPRQAQRPCANRTGWLEHVLLAHWPHQVSDRQHTTSLSSTGFQSVSDASVFWRRFSNGRLKFKRPFWSDASRKLGIFVIFGAGLRQHAGDARSPFFHRCSLLGRGQDTPEPASSRLTSP